MANKNKVDVSTGPTNRRLSSKERHAAHVAEIANKQSDLKREAAERRAKRDAESGANVSAPAGS
jgi:hypothetical protein